MQNTLFIILSYGTSFQKHLLFHYYVVAFSTANALNRVSSVRTAATPSDNSFLYQKLIY